MERPARIALLALLVLAGLAVMAFFGLLLAIADCGPACVRRGERAPAMLLIGGGALLVALGLSLRLGARRAAGVGLASGGAIALLGLAWTIADGARGAATWVSLAVAIGACVVGAWLVATTRRR